MSSSETALAFSVSSFEPAGLSTKQWKKVGVELGYPVTADMFENPEDDWLATASSGARARVEVTSSSTQRNGSVDKQWCDLDLPESRHSQGTNHDDAFRSHLESG